jgi:hypothetical protein
MGPAVSSSVIDVLILAQVAVNPAPKNPYIMAKIVKTGSDSANLQMAKQAIAATTVDKEARTSRGTLRSESRPKTNWPPTWKILINARSSAPLLLLRPKDEAYDGKYKDGKKYPNPCKTFEIE